MREARRGRREEGGGDLSFLFFRSRGEVERMFFFLFSNSVVIKLYLSGSGQVFAYPQCCLGRGLVTRVLEVTLEAREQGGGLHEFFFQFIFLFARLFLFFRFWPEELWIFF